MYFLGIFQKDCNFSRGLLKTFRPPKSCKCYHVYDKKFFKKIPKQSW